MSGNISQQRDVQSAEKGCTLKECLERSSSKGGRNILNLVRRDMSTELSVVLSVN